MRRSLAGLPDCWTRGNEGPATWCPHDVVGHLIHGEKADWIPRARIILAHGTTRAFDPFDREASLREGRGRPLAALLDEFTALRVSNLETLRGWNLGPAELEKHGMHPSLGEVTLAQLIATWVVHDLDHVVQVARVMAKQYTDAVGPWIEYLSVLRERT